MNPTTIDEAAVWAALRQIVDPEIDCNIVDLGLVYGVALDGAKVTVTITLTTRGCPLHESIARGVQHALLQLEGVAEAEVAVVWEPPWTPARMSAEGRERVGIFGD